MGKWRPGPPHKLGPRHRVPALKVAEEEGGRVKDEMTSEAGLQTKWTGLNSVPPKPMSFLEPQRVTLCGNRAVADTVKLRRGRTGAGWALNPVGLVSLHRGQTQWSQRGECHVKTGAETGAIHLQARIPNDGRHPPEARREARNSLPQEPALLTPRFRTSSPQKGESVSVV